MTMASSPSSARSRALGQEGDVLVAISTSGNSPNILKAVEAAKANGLITIGLLGKNGGKLKTSLTTLIVPSDNTARIQEAHILIGHILCQLIEEAIFHRETTMSLTETKTKLQGGNAVIGIVGMGYVGVPSPFPTLQKI